MAKIAATATPNECAVEKHARCTGDLFMMISTIRREVSCQAGGNLAFITANVNADIPVGKKSDICSVPSEG